MTPESTRDNGMPQQPDVVICGGGLAGLTLARQLLRETDVSVLVLDKRKELPPTRQKVGESTVQIGGWYFGRTLGLEKELFQRHFMKYNLRFYWPTAGDGENDGASRFEDYSQGYIRNFSNIPCYQIDRNLFEQHLIDELQADPRAAVVFPVSKLQIELSEDVGNNAHEVTYTDAEGQHVELRPRWVVDATGRGRALARRHDWTRTSEIEHAAFYWWVEGLVDIDELTDRDKEDVRLDRDRQPLGHLPTWLATNHFCAEGLWFWVIPLHGKTSLGLVFDKSVLNHRDVFSVEKATQWVCETFPCFARDLPNRKVLDFGGLSSYAHDCVQTLSPQRWALTGEAGRFSDPLYSPGSDLIAIYNTLIVDAIRDDSPERLQQICPLSEQLMRAVYQAYVPTYDVGYAQLGDAETFSLKYVWELSIYFGFYVFPFINRLFTDRRFAIAFLRRFGRLGPLNHGMQRLLTGYFHWKREHRQPPAKPIFFDFTSVETLARAAESFYDTGVDTDEAKRILDCRLGELEELARFFAVHVIAEVLDEPAIRSHRGFVDDLDLTTLDFAPEQWERRWRELAGLPGEAEWSIDPTVLEVFRDATVSRDAAISQEAAAREPALV
ncbi:MAG: NAD(P)-binding protein [Acidobacteriota bacterium]